VEMRWWQVGPGSGLPHKRQGRFQHGTQRRFLGLCERGIAFGRHQAVVIWQPLQHAWGAQVLRKGSTSSTPRYQRGDGRTSRPTARLKLVISSFSFSFGCRSHPGFPLPFPPSPRSKCGACRRQHTCSCPSMCAYVPGAFTVRARLRRGGSTPRGS